jgi:uncharacterized membrane protein
MNTKVLVELVSAGTFTVLLLAISYKVEDPEHPDHDHLPRNGYARLIRLISLAAAMITAALMIIGSFFNPNEVGISCVIIPIVGIIIFFVIFKIGKEKSK